MINKVKSFDKVIFRCPLKPLKFFFNHSFSDDFYNLLGEHDFQEALYFASRELSKSILENSKKTYNEKMSFALYKYFSRMCTRSTPFGLFAGVGITLVAESKNHIFISGDKEMKRITSIDMNYLCSLSAYLISLQSIREQLHYYPNNSIYKVWDKYRYVDYTYSSKKLRIHNISNIDYSDYLQDLLSRAVNGAKFDVLVKSLVSEDIYIEDATHFINELIQEQVLVSEIDPSITSDNYLRRIYDTLKGLDGVQKVSHTLYKIICLLEDIDKHHSKKDEWMLNYDALIACMEEIGMKYDGNHLFYTNSFVNASKSSCASLSTVDNIIGAMGILDKLTPISEMSNLNNFIEAFYKRYENREVALAIALDPELGIGYPAYKNDFGDASPLLENVFLNNNKNKVNQNLTLNKSQVLLVKKLLDAKSENKKIIEIYDEDFKDIPESNTPLNSTFSAFVEIVFDDYKSDKELIVLKYLGGSSALPLIGRFCYLDKALLDFAKEVARKDVELNEDKIVAEIVHFPESRVGNILIHPAFYDYEIPYLANSTLNIPKQISVNDMYLSIKNGMLVLKSKKLNKEIVPRLSNAHNYTNNSLPIYHFLCDMQYYKKRSALYFSWGKLYDIFNFFPRVVYKNIILEEATWLFKKSDVGYLPNHVGNGEAFKLWKDSFSIPQYIKLVAGDNELAFDFQNDFSIKVFLNTVKNRNSFIIKEFLHQHKRGIVSGKNGDYYSNQLVFSFHHE